MDSQILKQQGFEGFVTIDKLKSDPYQIPTKQGVYVVLLPQDSKPAFLENGTGGFFKDKNPNVPISELKANWVPSKNGQEIKKCLFSCICEIKDVILQPINNANIE